MITNMQMLWHQPHTRRTFLATTAVASLACVDRERAEATATAAGPPVWILYVGTYTKSGKSRGIYRLSVRTDTLALGAPELVAETPDPSFLALTPDGRTLIAVNELTTYAGSASGALSAFARDPVTHALAPKGPVRASRGAAPCYVSIERTGRFALVANYVGGNVAVFPVDTNGVLGEAVTVVAHPGKGPHPQRQASAHAHCIIPDAANAFVLAADLGTDKIYISRFDAATGAMSPAAVPEVLVASGAGPRHLAFSSGGNTLYCVNELNSTLVSFAYDATRGGLTERQVVSTRPQGATGVNAPADLHVHPNGHTVYVSNRGDNTIAVFAVDPTTQRVNLVQSMPTGGDWPRNFTLTPDGGALLVAHQRSGSITVFRIDPSSGQLTATGIRQNTPEPVSLLFA